MTVARNIVSEEREDTKKEISSSLEKNPIKLSVIIPTLNEKDNVQVLLQRLEALLGHIEWEVIFVDDDSTDGTAETIKQIASLDKHVRCLHRIGRRGLSSACIEGMLGSAAEYVAVMDADLQHDENVLLTMVETLDREDVDIVIGSRYMLGGGFGDWEASRKRISQFASRLAKMVIKSDVSDPMSGFFMLRRGVFQECARHLSGIGFKIGLDILMSAPTPLKIKEVPYEFGVRQAGASKLDAMVAWEYLMMLLDKLIGHIVPIRFVLFSLVGLAGLGVHMSILAVAFGALNVDFTISQVIATMVAMTFNYLLNNFLTYRDIRLRGWSFITGLLSFYAVCSVGAVANVGVAAYVFGLDKSWWIAGIAGVLVGAVWNYAVSSVYTWRRPKRA